ncbi:lipopolysaccharide assembly protein LapB [Ferrimonas balearica]|uniref:lipopolysaccharide assembly protein LapB n=1 Tax=Ferrimonas balearica TaxID=44012 RepID=UPI001F367C43|nr:lipopolysaccharide assembly protein LapB [Ferrimonas balearica]MBY6016623.1 lipopolysaccharide assembly protein LapB [Halomonas denitrificans]MBY6095084.1 lipopolysaccharide assembly protein LapB [Ferrimonas balearica]
MLELLFLLLPIAAAYGWYMGRRSVRIKQENSQRRLSQNYYEGLNFLLSDQPDKAVDLFIDMLQVDEETFDTHLSLGTLFRKRGEVDRSIRIHQNLIARPHISFEQRDLAMMELGKDYLAAGLYDRAEEIFLQLVKDPDHSEESERQLLSIYQATKEWWKAIRVAKRFKRASRKALMPTVAHYYCELAAQEQDSATVIKLLNTALKTDSDCARANVQLARLALSEERHDDAIAAFERLCRQGGGFAVEMVDAIEVAYQRRGQAERYHDQLEDLLAKEGQVSVLLALAHLVEQQQGTDAAQQLILSQLKRQPTMRGFHRLMRLQLAMVDSEQAKDSLVLLSDLVEKQIRLRPKYRCQNCGFPGHTLYWHCPSCKSWGQIKRIRGLDGE